MTDEPHAPDVPAQAHPTVIAAERGDGDAPEAAENAPSANSAAVHDDGVPSDFGDPSANLTQPPAESINDRSTIEAPTHLDRADERLTSIKAAIEIGVERVLAAFEDKLAYDASKQLQIDRLHNELQQHRANLVACAARPLLHGMIRLHGDIGKLLSALRAKSADELSPERFFSLLEGLQEDVEIVLGQNGVTTYREPAGPFDPRRQRILKKLGTSEVALAGTVAESIRPGFEQGMDILEKERVTTYELTQQPTATPGAASPEAPEGGVWSSEPRERGG